MTHCIGFTAHQMSLSTSRLKDTVAEGSGGGGATCHQATVSPTQNGSKTESGFLGGGTSHEFALFTLGFFSN